MITHTLEEIFIQSLASGPLLKSYPCNKQVRLISVQLKFSTPVTETVTITRVSAHGDEYNVNIATEDLDSNSSYIFHPCWEVILILGDSIKIECTNANLTGIVYGTVHIEGG